MPSLKHRMVVAGQPVPVHGPEAGCPICNEYHEARRKFEEAMHFFHAWDNTGAIYEVSMQMPYNPHPMWGGPAQPATPIIIERVPDAPEAPETVPNE